MKNFGIIFVAAVWGCTAVACAQQPQVPLNLVEREAMAPVMVPPLPLQLDFAGERVPLENFDTRESLIRELSVSCYMHSRTLLTLLATTRYFPIIEPILEQYGVPEDFKYLCMAESGLNPNVRSSAGASGLWQFMEAAGKEYGLFIGANRAVDERYHIEKSTEAACKYILDAKKRLGSWTLAAAAYNAGGGGVNSRMQKQGVTDYYDLFLPEETMRYVFRILSFKLITPNPSLYGFIIAPHEYYRPLTDYREIEVNAAQIDWSAVAREQGTNYKMLRELNHWIRDYTYANSARRTFVVRIPNADFRH
ncbi:MAG: lytic transglycosylase domain-containing protein [Rikenellaceae bacterium]|nr:lytic transglycosylase domain-containing protein [Rikenellaceae bacterium]